MGNAAEPLDLDRLLTAISFEESGGIPFPDGAVKIETMPDGSHEIAHGRYQIIESTWKRYTKWHISWAHEPGHARAVALMVLADCQKWYPSAGPARLDYCYSAGLNAAPFRIHRKAVRAWRVETAYWKR